MPDALKQFLTDINVVEPEEAPNFEFIPHIANNNVIQKFDKKPLVGEELRTAHRAVNANRPEQEQRNIEEAHETFTR